MENFLNAFVLFSQLRADPGDRLRRAARARRARRHADLRGAALLQLRPRRPDGLRHHGGDPGHLVAAEPRRLASARCRPRCSRCPSASSARSRSRCSPTAGSTASTASAAATPVIFVIASVGVMFIYNALTRFVIGTDDQRFEDGARFVIRVPDFKELTGLEEGLALRGSQVLTVVVMLIMRRRAVLVPAEDPHRQGDARLFRQRGPRAALRHQPRPRGDDHLDPRRRARHHRRHALRPRQVLPPLHLLPAAAADLRRGHRRRHRPAASAPSPAASSSPSPR